jgi:acyl-CoA dehydrogenase
MNGDETDLLIAAIEQICADSDERSSAAEEEFDERSWRLLERAGFTLVSVPADLGGSGGSLQQACAVTRAAGRIGLAGPLSETMWMAAWMLAASGVPVPRGPMTAALLDPAEVSLTRADDGWRIDGVLRRVPWAAATNLLVGLAPDADGGPRVVRLMPGAAGLRDGHNLAGEPRQDVICRDVHLAGDDVVVAGPAVTPTSLAHRAVLSRVAALAGAGEQVLDLATAQAKQREQFGRPLVRFQAVQQLLAQLAAETASVVVAAEAAALALEGGSEQEAAFAIAAAKASASSSAGSIAAWGHQVVGALGFTMEHRMQRSSRRLWSWREEYGNERTHHLDLAEQVMSGDAWDLIVDRHHPRR